MTDARNYWDEYYKEHEFSQTKEPNAFLQKMIGRLQRGKTLEVGMGEGVNAVYLAQKGFQVKGFDISQVAVDRAKELARETGVSLEASQQDLDMFLMGLMEYDSIVMIHFKPALSRYYPEIIRSLKQGGTVLIDSLHISAMGEAIGKEESYKDIYFRSNELLKSLSGLRILFYQEAKIDGKTRVQCLAQKPVDRDALKYKLFNIASEGSDGDGKSKQFELAEKLFK